METSGFQIQRTDDLEAPGLEPGRPDPCSLIIFGVTGDLSRRKLVPGLYNLCKEGSLPRDFAVVGMSRSAGDRDALLSRLRENASKYSRTQPIDDAVWAKFADVFEAVQGNLNEPDDYRKLRERLDAIDAGRGTRGNRLFYLAVPPSVFPAVLANLKSAGLIYDAHQQEPWSRCIVEKPFGHDLESARSLNNLTASVLDESQTFRIDHYLGKETVQNILVFRFGNAMFEPLWRREYIDHVELTFAESIGIEGRGAFYEETGVLRDIIQNHLLQVLALIAMEPPVSFDADEVRDNKTQVLRSLRPIVGSDVDRYTVAAQYAGYLDEEGVSKASRTPTYAAMRVLIDNWRWQGVPFYLRAGKGLAERVTQVSIHFKRIPQCLFGGDDVCLRVAPNILTIRIQPNEGIRLRFVSKVPGQDFSLANVDMDFEYSDAFEKAAPEAYERLLLDGMRGDATLFARRDTVELAWKFVTPILNAWEAGEGPLPNYERNSDGPDEARALVSREGRMWHRIKI